MIINLQFKLLKVLSTFVVLTFVLLQTACSKKSEQEAAGGSTSAKTAIQNSGSDTMVNLAQAWAEEYAKIEPSVSVEVSGGGSGTGNCRIDQRHRGYC